MPTYINLIQTSGGVEFQITEDGTQMAPHLVANDSFHGTYSLLATRTQAIEILQSLLGELPSLKETPPKYLRKQLQKKLAEIKAIEVAPLGVTTQ
jgi:hypothetical protein